MNSLNLQVKNKNSCKVLIYKEPMKKLLLFFPAYYSAFTFHLARKASLAGKLTGDLNEK